MSATRRCPQARTRQRGAAIILAMLVAALAATVAMAIAAEQRRWVNNVAARRDQVQAQSLALAAIQWSRQVLVESSGGGVDSLGQPWALPLPATPLENGSIEGRMVDAQGLLNVNNATLTGTQGDEERARLARLLGRQGVAAGAVDALADWIDPDAQVRGNGAEDAFYARQAAPYLTANAPLLRVGELAAVRYFDDAALARVLPYLTALPAGTPLNVNTAPLAVLAAALPGVAPEALARLATERVERPFTNIADFRNRLPGDAIVSDERVFSVSSNYFIVTVRARQGETVAQARALLKRTQGAWPAVVWQTLE
jgi:general secretion pathway protein K